MKPKINNLADIQREKQKLRREIGIQEYAFEFNMMQIKKKLSFATLTAYLLDMAMEQLKARSPSVLSRLMRWLLDRFVKNK
jgi:ABC-type Na+ transport system ATPase subunit NatA